MNATARTVGRAGKRRRLLASGIVVAALLYGSAAGTDDLFPFGPMTQYSFRTDPNGEIRSLFVEADTASGRRVDVDLSSGGVGVARAEVEGQLHTIIADPSWLQGLATAQRRLHPQQPQFTRIYVRTLVIDLRDGREADRRVDTLATWTVRR